MLRALPGYSHLKILTPTVAHPSRVMTTQVAPDASLRGLIQVALDAAFGMRPETSLRRPLFDTQVRVHVAAHLKRSALRGPVTVQRIDVHPAPTRPPHDPLEVAIVAATEFIGSYTVAGTTKAFAGRGELPEGKRQWVLRSLRLM